VHYGSDVNREGVLNNTSKAIGAALYRVLYNIFRNKGPNLIESVSDALRGKWVMKLTEIDQNI